MALVMYDLDGTLVNTVAEIAYAANCTLAQFNHVQVSISQIEKLIGKGTEWLMAELWPDKTLVADATTWRFVMQTFTNHYSDVVGSKSELYPRVLETLATVKALGIKQAVVTNKEQPFTDLVLEKNGIKSYFDCVIGGNTLTVRKPDSAVIHHCLNSLNENKASSLFVGDSSVDIAVAKNANITCWVVPYGYNAGKDIRLSNPDKVINDISAVLSYFNSNQPAAINSYEG